MERNYLKDKKIKKKSALQGAWLLVIFGIIFAAMLARLAISDSVNLFNGLPNSDDAYSIAEEFITPMVLSGNVQFSDSDYRFAKKSDSVYVIKSFYTAKDADGDKSKTNFTIILKYKGGPATKTKNWAMLNLDQGR